MKQKLVVAAVLGRWIGAGEACGTRMLSLFGSNTKLALNLLQRDVFTFPFAVRDHHLILAVNFIVGIAAASALGDAILRAVSLFESCTEYAIFRTSTIVYIVVAVQTSYTGGANVIYIIKCRIFTIVNCIARKLVPAKLVQVAAGVNIFINAGFA